MKLEYAIETIVIAVLLAVCIIFAINQRKKHPGSITRSVIKVLYSVLIPLTGNLISIIAFNRTIAIIGYTILLIGMNLVIFNMYAFTMDYCEFKYRGTIMQKLITILIALNCGSVLANTFLHHVFDVSLEYITVDDTELFFIIVSGYGRYINYAVLTLVMLIMICAFISKCVKVAQAYREKYIVLLASLALCIAWETHVMFSDSSFDRSTTGYVICCYLIYYFTFCYKPFFIRRYLADSVIDNHTDGIIFYDIEVNPIYANEKAYTILEVNEKNPDKCTDVLIDITGGVDINTDFDLSTRYKDSLGKFRYININHRLMKDKNGLKVGSFFNVHDNTEEVERNEQRRWRATHDELTGLYNRSRFTELVDKLRQYNPSDEFYMIVSDISDFKFINEMFGRKEADNILISMGRCISENCHSHTTFCRWGDDIFAAFARKSDVNPQALDRLVQAKSTEITHINRPLVIHLGLYESIGCEVPVNVMVDRCLLAIASIKEDYSKHIVFYDDKLRKSRIWEQQVTAELDEAIRTRQIIPYIQPQYDNEGNLEGGELLVRWIHPTEGFLPPYRFIPIIEKNGMISKVDKYMWESACVILSRWKNEGRELSLSINISPKDFYFMDIYYELTKLVEKYRISPAKLHLEITESSVMNNAQENIATLNHLRDYGFTVEMDDFGSGYSSLNMLKDMPIDVLKIDMVFLSKTSNYEKSTIILQSIINMANDLKLAQITEGVETRDQLDMLCKMGCKLFQGYYFSKPIPVDEFCNLPHKAF